MDCDSNLNCTSRQKDQWHLVSPSSSITFFFSSSRVIFCKSGSQKLRKQSSYVGESHPSIFQPQEAVKRPKRWNLKNNKIKSWTINADMILKNKFGSVSSETKFLRKCENRTQNKKVENHCTNQLGYWVRLKLIV